MPEQRIVWCEQSAAKQSDIETGLSKKNLVIRRCTLSDLGEVLDGESDAVLVISGYKLGAELKALIRRAELENRPLLIITDKLNINDINRIADLCGAVIAPANSDTDPHAWIRIAEYTRASYVGLQQRIAKLEKKLEERKDIDRAKGLLMKMHDLDEESAFKALRTSAMKNSMTLGQVARNLLSSLEAV